MGSSLFSISLSTLLTLGSSAWGAELLHPQEVKPVTEARDINVIVETLMTGVRAQFKKDGKALRDVHSKHHGCVNGTFTVFDKLPAPYSVGLFAKAREYPAVARFSNGREFDDREGDVRGLGIKIMDVPGDKLLEDERDAKTQDFLFINHNRFFIKNNADYVSFIKATGQGNPFKFFLSWNPLNWHVSEMLIVREIRNKVVKNPVESQYFTTVPSLMGETPAKFSLKPCKEQKYEYVTADKNQLGQALAAQLLPGQDNKGVCFEFQVQLQTDPRRMSVEDSRPAWSEKLSKYKTVARLDISAQDFLAVKDGDRICENLSLTPWHSLPEHRPLGNIQRARKAAYQQISILRHELNKEKRQEP